WHETLNLNDLFDEMFVSTCEYRHLLAQYFYKIHASDTTPDGDESTKPEVDTDVDEALLIAGTVSFLNFIALGEECNLALKQSEDEEIDAPWDVAEQIEEEANKRTLLPNRITRFSIEQFIGQNNKFANFYRNLLPRSFFNSDLYKANLKQFMEENGDS